MKICYIAVLLLFVSTTLLGQDYIRPPNGTEYKIEMIDPVVHVHDDLEAIHEFFKENGYVIVEGISEKENREAVVQLMDEVIQAGILGMRRLGFLDLYHDDTLAQLRQDPRVYNVFSKILGTEKLWIVFDRVIFQKANENEDPLPPHVDQNPVTHPGFSNLQGMIALRDMNESTGTLAVIPKSPRFFHEYAQWVKPKDGYVEYQGELKPSFVGLRMKEGQLVIWDSRTTHSRFRKVGESDRYAALITFTTAKEKQDLIDLRIKYFTEGTGCNNHEAGLRATAPPRYQESLRRTDENLTTLGRKLYGFETWENTHE